jgi:hypothetical protein
MRVAFHLSNFSVRGSEIATFDYAKGNKTVLHNESVIVAPAHIRKKKDYLGQSTYHADVERMFTQEFGQVYAYTSQADLNQLLISLECDVFYVLKSGERDEIGENLAIDTAVHCVFVCQRECAHGSVYAAISRPVVGKYYNGHVDSTFDAPIVPHVCAGGWSDSGTITRDLRAELLIPREANVFGRHGGFETFDLPFVHSAIRTIVDESPNNYFIFMNTQEFTARHPRIIFLNTSTDPDVKYSFVAMCDAMLHGRSAGESFGLSVAEFALQGKPVITYKPDKPIPEEHDAHRLELGGAGVYYKDEEELLAILRGFHKRTVPHTGYSDHTMERVMHQFGRVFLGMDIPEEEETYVMVDPQPWTIRLLCNWTTSADLTRTWSKLGEASHVALTEDEDADYTVIVNKPPQGAHWDPANTIVLRMEPNEDEAHHWNDWYDDRKNFMIFANHANYHNNCEWHLSTDTEQIQKPVQKDIALSQCVAAIISDQMLDEGHVLRVRFVQHLQNDGSLYLHVYGRGNPGFQNHRGELPYHAKDAGVLPYRYAFNAENRARANYFSEKIVDLILGECLAFYWGCPNIEEFIDPRAYIKLDLHDFDGSMRIMKEAIANDEWSKRLPYIREAKKRILKYYAFIPRMENLIQMTRLHIAIIANEADKAQHLAMSDARIKNATVFRTYDEAGQACLESGSDWLVISGNPTYGPRFLDRISQFYAEVRDAQPDWGAGITYCYGGMPEQNPDEGWACGTIGKEASGPVMSYLLSPRGACHDGYPVLSTFAAPTLYSKVNII